MSKEGCETKKKKRRVVCCGCEKVLPVDHGGITCVNECAVCLECSPTLVDTILSDLKFPLKCPSCSSPMVVQSVERQLTAEQFNIFLLYAMQADPKFLDPDEVIDACPHCPYWEVSRKTVGRLMFFCRRDGCKAVTCVWCKKALRKAKLVGRHADVVMLSRAGEAVCPGLDEEESKETVTTAAFDKHRVCAELGPFKERWDEAMRLGGGSRCPQCGLVGRKDNACTHMRCPQCQTRYCYVCELAEADCDKEKGDSIMQHQIGWKTNPKRCPMWLDNVNEVDGRYPKSGDSDVFVDFFNALKTKKLLQQCVKELASEGMWDQLDSHYNLSDTCGFDMGDIVKGEHILIKRPSESSAD